MDTNVKAAWIAAAGVILAAIIGGIFGLIKLSPATQQTPTQQLTPIVNIGGNYSDTMQNTTSNVSGRMTLVIQQNQTILEAISLSILLPLAVARY